MGGSDWSLKAHLRVGVYFPNVTPDSDPWLMLKLLGLLGSAEVCTSLLLCLVESLSFSFYLNVNSKLVARVVAQSLRI